MALFDQTLTIEGKLEDIWQRVQGEVTPEQQIVMNKPTSTLLTLDKQYGYLYVMRATPDGDVRLRHIVDTASRVREVFRIAQGSERLSLLAQPSSDIDIDEQEFIADEAQQRLSMIQRVRKAKIGASSYTTLRDEQPPQYTEKAKRSGDAPSNPLTYFGYVFFATTIGVGIAYGVNWRKLGKPQWTLPTIVLAVILPLIALASLLPLILLMAVQQNLLRIGFFGVFALFGASWGLLFALLYLQYPPYSKWKNGDDEGMYHHSYDLFSATLIVLGVALIGGIISLVAIKPPDNNPRNFQSNAFEVNYPHYWQTRDLAELNTCQQTNIRCELALTNRDRYATIIFYWVSLDEPQSLDEYAEARWQRIEASNSGVQTLNVHHIQINGREAFTREYLEPFSNSDLPVHVMLAHMVWDEQTMFSITAYADCTCTFDNNREDIEAIIQSVRLPSSGG